MNLDFLETSRPFNVQQGVDLLNSGGYVTLSWGIENARVLSKNVKDGKMSYKVQALAFEVNGLKFQGTVVLSVNFMDYYEARFYKGDELVHHMKDIFVADVISQIDEYVEKQESYAY